MTMLAPEGNNKEEVILNPEWKEKKHTALRAHLDVIKEVCYEWIQTAVALAKKANLKYYDFRKTLARILQEKKICLDGYRKDLEIAWYSAA